MKIKTLPDGGYELTLEEHEFININQTVMAQSGINFRPVTLVGPVRLCQLHFDQLN